MTLQEILDRVLNTLEEDKALADDMQSAVSCGRLPWLLIVDCRATLAMTAE